MKFIVDCNAGKLAKWLRVMGYDTLFIRDIDDNDLIRIGIREKRIVLTKDSHIRERRIVSEGKVKVVLLEDDNPKEQLRQVVKMFYLDLNMKPFSLCLECNEALVPRKSKEVENLVPPYVFKTQSNYMECPACHRIYWKGTHWQRMKKGLEKLLKDTPI